MAKVVDGLDVRRSAGSPVDLGSSTLGRPLSSGPRRHLDRLVNGNGRWRGLNSFNTQIGPGNVVVTYERSGLGYKGRPRGAVVTVSLTLRNVTFDLPMLGALLGLDQITIPAMPVTVTSEDLETDSGA